MQPRNTWVFSRYMGSETVGHRHLANTQAVPTLSAARLGSHGIGQAGGADQGGYIAGPLWEMMQLKG